MQVNNGIATLSSKVRNDRGRKKIRKEIQRMDSRLRGNDISGMMGLPRTKRGARNDREREVRRVLYFFSILQRPIIYHMHCIWKADERLPKE